VSTNDIIKPITPDRLKDGRPSCGFDGFNQLWVRRDDGDAIYGNIVADVRGHVCPICQRGWENTTASIADQEFLHDMKRHAHRTCVNGYGHVSNFRFWHELMCSPDINREGLEFTEIPNQYGSYWTGPWYRVEFKHLPTHPFIVGARKRVFHIEMGGVDAELAGFLKLSFEAEKVTMEHAESRWLIHAWTREKAAKYVETMATLAVNWDAEILKKSAAQSEPSI
jgi:hypothetical protein